MDKKEMLDYLSEKKRLTEPVAVAENHVRAAKQDYEKARRKWKWGINILIVFVVLFIWDFLTDDRRLFYFDEHHTIQAGGLGGIILFGGILLLLLYVKSRRYTNPAKSRLAEAQNILQQEKISRIIETVQKISLQNFTIIPTFFACGKLSMKKEPIV